MLGPSIESFNSNTIVSQYFTSLKNGIDFGSVQKIVVSRRNNVVSRINNVVSAREKAVDTIMIKFVTHGLEYYYKVLDMRFRHSRAEGETLTLSMFNL